MRANKFRSQTGSDIVEFVPTLVIIFIVLLFPLMDLVVLSLTYAAGAQLNHEQLRTAVTMQKSLASAASGPICGTTYTYPDGSPGVIPGWLNGANGAGGIGKWANLDAVGALDTKVTYKDGIGGDKVVVVTTTVKSKPLLQIPVPFLANIPGFGKSVSFQFINERLLEDPRNYSQ